MPVHSDGTLLKDVRSNHFRQYPLQREDNSMLVAREGRSATPIDIAAEGNSLAIATPLSEVTLPGGPYTLEWAHENGHDNFEETKSNIQEMTMSPLALCNQQPPEFGIGGLGVESVACSPMPSQSDSDHDRITFVTPPATGEVDILVAACHIQHMRNLDELGSPARSLETGLDSDAHQVSQAEVLIQMSKTRRRSKKQQTKPSN